MERKDPDEVEIGQQDVGGMDEEEEEEDGEEEAKRGEFGGMGGVDEED